MPKSPALDILFEDDHLVIINKPAGVPVIPSRTSEMERSIKYILKQKYGEILIVHRIDQDTSGLVILAKNADTHRKLNTMFQNRNIEKTYWLLTRGIPHKHEGEINFALKKLNNQNKSVAHKDGKAALTTYKVVEKFTKMALCEAQLHSGRHHQIRAHFKAINYPLLVDPVYGESGFFLSEIKAKKYKKAKHEEERPLLKRLSLHAHRLKFEHPITKELIVIEAPIPKDLRACLNQLRKN